MSEGPLRVCDLWERLAAVQTTSGRSGFPGHDPFHAARAAQARPAGAVNLPAGGAHGRLPRRSVSPRRWARLRSTSDSPRRNPRNSGRPRRSLNREAYGNPTILCV